jgi:protein-disulfide isomerase
VTNVEELRAVGREVGNPDAFLQVIAFLDLECAACALYHEKVVRELRQGEARGDVSPVYVHCPLRSHRFAPEAAHAAECAAEQGRFGEFVEHALAAQDRFASQPWQDFAAAVGSADSTEYWSCLVRDSLASRVNAGRRAGERAGVSGTPTLVVNGWRYRTPPTLDQIRRHLTEGSASADRGWR